MYSRLGSIVLGALLIFPSIGSIAQGEHDAQFWLTTPDRSALLAPQGTSFDFSASGGEAPTIVVNDMQRFQSIDGFGFALTGGSAQLLIRMEPTKRAALLKELFTGDGNGIDVSYVRV